MLVDDEFLVQSCCCLLLCCHPLVVQGYKILPAPAGYQPIYTPARKLMATPTPGMFGGVSGTPLYSIPSENDNLKQVYGGAEMPEGLPELKPEDMTVSTVRCAGSHCKVTWLCNKFKDHGRASQEAWRMQSHAQEASCRMGSCEAAEVRTDECSRG